MALMHLDVLCVQECRLRSDDVYSIESVAGLSSNRFLSQPADNDIHFGDLYLGGPYTS